jgi:hypothetical protein
VEAIVVGGQWRLFQKKVKRRVLGALHVTSR